jgi:hypothetical protein
MTTGPRRARRQRSTTAAPADTDGGRAILELIVLGVLVMIPMLYIAISLLQLQATTFATTQAARDAARLLDNAPSIGIGQAQALAAAHQTLTDHNVSAEGLQIRYVNTGADCQNAPKHTPDLIPGTTYDICVIDPLNLPHLPDGLTAANKVIGIFTLHVGEFRETR